MIRHLLSRPLTSQMDEAIMGASGGKSQLPSSPLAEAQCICCLNTVAVAAMPFLEAGNKCLHLDKTAALLSWSCICSVHYCYVTSLNFKPDCLYPEQRVLK